MTEYKYRAFHDGVMYTNVARLNNALYWNQCRSFDLLAFKQKDPAIIMEFTSLYDKNRTEIYESDVIAKFDFEDSHFRSVVVRHLGAFGYWSYGDFIAFATNYHFEWSHGKSDRILVVGNIYENPELMESANKKMGGP